MDAQRGDGTEGSAAESDRLVAAPPDEPSTLTDAAPDGEPTPPQPDADAADSLDAAAGLQPAGDSTAWISWLRFVAIAGVVAIHTAGFTAVAEGTHSRVKVVATILDIGSTFTVPLFVMLSGALLLDPARYPGPRDFLRKRAGRLIPALIFWHLFYWGFRVFFRHQVVPPKVALEWAMSGVLYTALYFFWIILGLAIVTPVLMPWIASVSRRTVGLVGCAAAAMPVLTISSYFVVRRPAVWVELPWTWWIFYLGLFLLGWALRDVILRGPWLLLAAMGIVVLGASLVWQWRNADAPSWLSALSPVSYFGLGVHLYTVLIFVVGHSLIRDDGLLRVLARGTSARVGRVLGDATLGVYALHLAVLGVLTRLAVGGRDQVVSSVSQLLLRILAVLVVTYAIVLVLRKVPFVRRVL